ncbi:MAG: fumarate reductase subunit FrdD [Deltaproteobacteria bacterium]|nr:fumarate reductase subunit FrdD [Deltaproteobacteria bacterium]
MAAQKTESFWWLLFSAGGMMSAIFLPGHVFFQGLAMQLGWLPESATSYGRMVELLSHPIAKLYLLALISLSLFHAGHRLKHVVSDLGLEAPGLVAFIFYGVAFLGTGLTVFALANIG